MAGRVWRSTAVRCVVELSALNLLEEVVAALWCGCGMAETLMAVSVPCGD